jgi:diacylglycerol kinase (ATP)
VKKFNVIILAGGEKGPLFEPTGYEIKALIPVHGKPMIDWVVESFAACEAVNSIVVVGDRQLDACASMVKVKKRIFTGANLFQNLLHAVTYIKTTIYKNAPEHDGYVISFCDAVFLTPWIISDTLASIAAQDASLVLHYVEKASFEKAGLPAKRTYIPIGGKLFTGTTIYYLKKFSLLQNALLILLEMRKHRKDPRGLLNALGCDGTSFAEVETVVGERLGAPVRIIESPHARLGMDVDKKSDLELAISLLFPPWNHSYKKAAVIYNPAAGSGRPLPRFLQWLFGVDNRIDHERLSSDELMSTVLTSFGKMGIDATWYETEKKGDAQILAQKCIEEGCDCIIVAGGDGTINEAVNGGAGRNGSVIGMIPLGTANLFALSMNIPRSIKGACQHIASGKTQAIDCGRAGERYFTLMAGAGFDAFIVRNIGTKKKTMFGTLGYLPAIFQYLLRYTFQPIMVTIDEQRIPRKGYIVIVGNTRYYGGRLELAPEADMTDGYLDVTIFRHRHVFALLKYLFCLWRGKTEDIMSREYFQAKKVQLHARGKVPVHVDAEYIGNVPLAIEVCPAVLTVAGDG